MNINANNKQVMLLIDADNVSGDVIEQALAHVLSQHGAVHVRRAYCTAEAAVTHQKLFRQLSIRPMVNLATGKNSTDIALAVDAIDLVISERPAEVVIVSSDSDFAPLVARLREKGCRVCGIGQLGKTGDESPRLYDDFIDLAHRKSKPGERGTAKVRRADSARAPKAETAGGRRSGRRAEPVIDREPAAELAPPDLRPEPPPEPAPAPAAKRTRRTRKSAETLSAAAPVAAPAPPAPRAPEVPEDVRRMLDALPELRGGGKVELGVAAERLRGLQLLSKNAPSTKLFKKYADHFVLSPDRQPNKVQYRWP